MGSSRSMGSPSGYVDHTIAAGIELVDQRLAPFERGALVDVALVGDLVTIDRWRLGHEDDALDAHRGALALGVHAGKPFAHGTDHGGMRQKFSGRQLRALV